MKIFILFFLQNIWKLAQFFFYFFWSIWTCPSKKIILFFSTFIVELGMPIEKNNIKIFKNYFWKSLHFFFFWYLCLFEFGTIFTSCFFEHVYGFIHLLTNVCAYMCALFNLTSPTTWRHWTYVYLMWHHTV